MTLMLYNDLRFFMTQHMEGPHLSTSRSTVMHTTWGTATIVKTKSHPMNAKDLNLGSS
jgi:hypothetical protein